MICNPERLSNYLDGELNPDEVKELQQHLTSCEQCQADLAAYRGVDSWLGRLERKPTPSKLRRAVYSRVEERRRARSRLIGLPPQVGPAMPLALGLALMAGSVALWRLAPPTPAPLMTAAFVVQESPESLDGLRVELVFDSPIAADSLAEGVRFEPTLAVAHRVRDNKVELIPQSVVAETSYKLTVSKVRDHRGNVQSEPVVLDLTTGPGAMLVQASSPEAVAAPVAETVAEPGVQSQPRAEDSAVLAEKPGSGGLEAYPSQPSIAAGPRLGPNDGRMAVTAPRAPTLVSGISGNTALSSGPLQSLDLDSQLGLASGTEKLVRVGEQAFQGGAMLVRADTDEVFVLIRSSARWTGFSNTWRPGEVLASAGSRPLGTLDPLRSFGKIWRDQPAVKVQLGWPVYEERNLPGRVQSFERGALIRSSHGVAYVLFADGTWRTLLDRA